MKCARCNGTVVLENDPWDGPTYKCLQCGRSPNIQPLGEWIAQQYAQPQFTGDYYKTGSKAPPTPRYD